MSPDATAEKPNKLIVWLHPSAGQDSAGMNDTVEAMAPMFLRHGYALVVFTQKNYSGWSESDGKKLFVSLEKIGHIPGVDARKPILFGYSAGGQMALEMWMKDPGRFGGMVLDAAYPIQRTPNGGGSCEFIPTTRPGDDAMRNAPVLALVGLQDGGFTVWKGVEAGWKQAGVPLEIIYVPGKKHEWLFDAPRTELLEQWLSQVAAGQLPGHDVAAPAGGVAPTGKQETSPAQPTDKKRGALGVRLDGDAVIVSVMEHSARGQRRLAAGRCHRPHRRPADQAGPKDIAAALTGKTAGDKVRVNVLFADGKDQVVHVMLGRCIRLRERSPGTQERTAKPALI